MDPNKLRAYGKDMVELVAQYWENIEDYPVLSTVTPFSIFEQIPPEAPEDPESWEDIKTDIHEIIMPGITHWHSPRFNAYFPAGNSYPAICADILCDGIGCIGFSWISSPACTELEIAMMNWLGRLLRLPEEFLYGPHSKGGGVIQGTASESTYIALLAAKARITKRYQQQLSPDRQQRHHRPKSLLEQRLQPSVLPPTQKQEKSHESVQFSESHLRPQPMDTKPATDQGRPGGIVDKMTYSIDHVQPGTAEPVVVAPYCTVVKQPKIKMDITAGTSLTSFTGDTSESSSSPPMYGIMSTLTTTVTTMTKMPHGGRVIPLKTKTDKDRKPKKQPIPIETKPVQKTKHSHKAPNSQKSEKASTRGVPPILCSTSAPVTNTSPMTKQYPNATVTPSNKPHQSMGHSLKNTVASILNTLPKYKQNPRSTVSQMPEYGPQPRQCMGHSQKSTVSPSDSSSTIDTYTLKTVTSLPPIGGKCFHDRLVAYASIEAHSSVAKAGLLASVRVRLLPTDSQCSLRGATLEDAITEDKAKGDVPFMIVATLGTTSSVAFDNIKELGRIAQREGMWMHIDAAYAGSAFICPEFRPMLDGVELVDSFNFNPHKWLLINFDCSTMWVKNSEDLTEAFQVNPQYLAHEKQRMITDYRNWMMPQHEEDLHDFVFQQDRAPPYFHHNQVNLAREFHRNMMKYEQYEFIGDNNLGTICFRIKGSNELNDELYNRINKAGKIYITKSEIHTVPKLLILRFAICSPLTKLHHVHEALNEINRHACKVMKLARHSKGTTYMAPSDNIS